MKIALAQLNYRVGNLEYNTAKIKETIVKAKEQQVDLVVFSEMAICGYPPKDLLKYDKFITECLSAIRSISSECKGISAIIGAPTKFRITLSTSYNSAFLLYEGKKFCKPEELNRLKFKGHNFVLTIGNDIPFYLSQDMYIMTLLGEMRELFPKKSEILVNISASPFDYTQVEKRKKLFTTLARKFKIPVFFVNHVGGQGETLYDGGSMVVSPNGEIYDELKYFEEDIKIYDLKEIKTYRRTTSLSPYHHCPDSEIEQKDLDGDSVKIQRIHDALIMGIKDYFDKTGFKKALVGLSGGLDSAVALALTVKALGKENVWAIMMPSHFSTKHSIEDAVKLAKNLDIKHNIIEIENIYNTILDALQPQFKNLPFDVTEENIQARIRCVLLMALANKFICLVLNTSNKSEIATGYGTMYGDITGSLSVLGDVYKTDVYKLAHYINKDKELIQKDIITKTPSAELRPNQKDSDSIPEYEILDPILYQYIEEAKEAEQIIKKGFEKATVLKVIKLIHANEYKRHQAPPILRVSPKPFGTGFNLPLITS